MSQMSIATMAKAEGTRKRNGPRPNDKTQIMARQHQRISRKPILLSGVEPGKRITIKASEFDQVDVDRRYQRDKITSEINDLIYVLQNNGEIPDPITVVRRTFSEDGRVSPKLWIIDGQQRFMAHLECGRDIQAVCHGVDSIEAEKAFFLVMNTRRSVGANSFVQSWPWLSAEMVRRVDTSRGHPLYGRVAFTSTGKSRIGAAILVRGMAAAMTGQIQVGRIDHVLNAADAAIKDAKNRSRAEAFLGAVGHAFPAYAPMLAVVAFGRVCAERWAERIEGPSATIASRIRRINWRAEVPGFAERFRPVLEARIKKLWAK